MTQQEKLRRDIDALRERVRLSWLEMDSKSMTLEERAQIRRHILDLIAALNDLLIRLDEIPKTGLG